MKQYPYNDTTDIIVYDNDKENGKKKKEPKTWVVAVSSALAASIFTVAIGFGVQSMHKEVPLLDTTTAGTTVSSTETTTDGAVTAAYSNKTVLTVPEIASKVGPSVVGVINKTTVTTSQYWDPWSGRYYYD